MNVVIEGLDASGKTTLARQIARRYHMPIQQSEGPPHYPGEINKRIERYLRFTDTIFDRHPAVSQPIYGTMRQEEWIDPHLLDQFYMTRPVFIYCDPTLDYNSAHRASLFDTKEHLDDIDHHYDDLLAMYRVWAAHHAQVIYRVPAKPDYVYHVLDHALGKSSNGMFQDIVDFHNKFGLLYDGPPRQLPKDIAHFRQRFLQEECNEYANAVTLPGKLDALVDLVYVALGTALLHGFYRFQDAWDRVHEVNMRKVRATDPSQSLRNSAHDVIKPPGWQPADLTDLVGQQEELFDGEPAGQSVPE